MVITLKYIHIILNHYVLYLNLWGEKRESKEHRIKSSLLLIGLQYNTKITSGKKYVDILGCLKIKNACDWKDIMKKEKVRNLNESKEEL